MPLYGHFENGVIYVLKMYYEGIGSRVFRAFCIRKFNSR